jgi:hypothetical protein
LRKPRNLLFLWERKKEETFNSEEFKKKIQDKTENSLNQLVRKIA